MRNNLALLLTLCLGIFNVTLYGTEEFYSLCEKNDQESARRYIREHPACVTQAYKGQLPLHMASFYGLIDVVRDLLANDSVDHHATVVPSDKIMTSGFNALHLAAEQGHFAVVECLLKQSAIKHDSVVMGNSVGGNGFNALHIAARFGHLAVIECLLRQSTIKHDSVVTGNNTADGYNALHIAADKCHPAVVKCLLEQSTIKHDSVVTGNSRGGDGFNALHIAAVKGHLTVVECLLRQSTIRHNSVVTGPNVWKGFNSLHIATARGCLAVVDCLLRQSTIQHDSVVAGNEHDWDGFNALHIATYRGNRPTVDLIINSGKISHSSPVLFTNHDFAGFSPVMLALHQDRLASLQSLVYAGASLANLKPHIPFPYNQAVAYWRKTALATQRLIPLVESLLQSMAQRKNLLIKSQVAHAPALVSMASSMIPYVDSMGKNSAHSIQSLVADQADIDYYDTAGRTLLHAAMGPGDPDQAMPWDELAKWLITDKMLDQLLVPGLQPKEDLGEKLSLWINRVARDGTTPLNLAVRYDNRRIVLLLLRKRPSLYSIYAAIQECAACNHDLLRKIFLRAAYGPDTAPSTQTHKRPIPDNTTPTDEEDSQQLTAKKQRL